MITATPLGLAVILYANLGLKSIPSDSVVANGIASPLVEIGVANEAGHSPLPRSSAAGSTADTSKEKKQSMKRI